MLEKHLGRHAPNEVSPFTALNTAFDSGRRVLPCRRQTSICPPSAPGLRDHSIGGRERDPSPQPVVVESGARASMVESYVTLAEGESYWNNAVTEVVPAPTHGWSTPGFSARASGLTTLA